jgi:hypothetical protein
MKKVVVIGELRLCIYDLVPTEAWLRASQGQHRVINDHGNGKYFRARDRDSLCPFPQPQFAKLFCSRPRLAMYLKTLYIVFAYTVP